MNGKKKFFALLLCAAIPFGTACCSRYPIDVKYETIINKTVESTEHVDTVSTIEDTSAGYWSYPDDADSSEGGYMQQGNFETPFAGDASVLFGGMTGVYEQEATALRTKVQNLPDTLKAAEGHHTFYVSYRGDDVNSGYSANAPLFNYKSAYRIAKPGDVILFERGGVYRGNIKLKDGVSIGAYGTGKKPCIYGSLKNYAVAADWEDMGGNVWAVDIPAAQGAVGALIYDNGVAASTYKKSLADLKKEAEENSFCYNSRSERVFVYSPKGNPGSLFSSIEVCGTGHVVDAPSGESNITIENICVKYGGEHGISFVGTTKKPNKNITIRGCEVGFIGGCVLGTECRYGNGIQFWKDCSDILIENCWVYHCFDTGLTPQYKSGDNNVAVMKNITFADNLIEYCNYALEYYNDGGITENQKYLRNICRFAGYGVFPAKNRIGGIWATTGATSLLVTWSHMEERLTNFVVADNIFDTTSKYLLDGASLQKPEHNILQGNYYAVQTKYPTLYDTDKTLLNRHACKFHIPYDQLADYKVTSILSQTDMMNKAKALDPNVKEVRFVDNR